MHLFILAALAWSLPTAGLARTSTPTALIQLLGGALITGIPALALFPK